MVSNATRPLKSAFGTIDQDLKRIKLILRTIRKLQIPMRSFVLNAELPVGLLRLQAATTSKVINSFNLNGTLEAIRENERDQVRK